MFTCSTTFFFLVLQLLLAVLRQHLIWSSKAHFASHRACAYGMVLICLEYTVATAFEIELNLFSLEEVMEHEHGVAAVRFVALGLDALGWYAFKTNVVSFIALLVLQPIDVALLSQKDALACVDFALRLNDIAYSQQLPVYNVIRAFEIEIRMKLTKLLSDQFPAVLLLEGIASELRKHPKHGFKC